MVEFCFDPLYWPMHDCYSTTFPNGSAKHAWRAGFREGVKMCLNQGRKPTVGEFRDAVYRRNMDNLSIWHNVGDDVEHGIWAVLGSRMGTHMTMLGDWDYRNVQSFDALERLWEAEQFVDPYEAAETYAKSLYTQLDLAMNLLSPKQSKFFKHHYRSNWCNQGIMIREIDVIRRQEGW